MSGFFSSAAGDRSRNAPNTSTPHPISWIEADVLDLPFADNYFNAATMGYGLRNVIDIPAVLKSCTAFLNPCKSCYFRLSSSQQFAIESLWYLDKIEVQGRAFRSN